ncbi:L-lysine 2,3-aminomutase [Neorhodopirellula lusitana]|uniref:L-lysine 2,3-aminomutase n=2 Tax=Neorhodopirellula lusitana TaxID=445327 RepID=A0ABY1Q3C9_9BACT|nr:L-lysine 2,3-aminomutase [Neorhodopirellula lusitana]
MQPESLATDRLVVLPIRDKDFEPGNHDDSRWLESMRTAIRSASELRRALNLPTRTEIKPETSLPNPAGSVGDSTDTPAANSDQDYDFPVFVTREFVSRMKPGDWQDPLLRQVMPIAEEGLAVEGFGSDPVGDLNANVAPGVLHKYQGRALLVTSGACGIHCRYCFRREFPYAAAGSRKDAYQPSLEYLQTHPDVEEVILSGGDPLTSTDEALDDLITRLEAIPHVKRLRFHTRMPIVVPSRVTQTLLARLKRSRLTTWVVVHSNHAAEIDQATQQSLERMVDAGIPVLNQAVLLRGVNDSVDVLEALSRRLLDCRVTPYYLHQLDRVSGASHFEVPVQRGRELIAALESRLPGFAVPRYVAEITGRESKTRL